MSTTRRTEPTSEENGIDRAKAAILRRRTEPTPEEKDLDRAQATIFRLEYKVRQARDIAKRWHALAAMDDVLITSDVWQNDRQRIVEWLKKDAGGEGNNV